MAEHRIFSAQPRRRLRVQGGRFALAAFALAAALAASPPAAAQPQPPPKPAPPAPPPIPPSTGTDLELDPDAPKAPAEEPTPEEPPPLPPAPEGTWGVGGKEGEGKYAPAGKTGSLKEQEDEAREEAEEKGAGPVDLGPPGAVWVDTVIGFGDIVDVTNSEQGITGVTVVSIVPGVSYRFGEIWTVAVRLPYSNASITGPGEGNGDDYSTGVLGNLEITVRPSFQLTRRFRLPVSVSFYAPTAPGDLLAGPTDTVPRAQYLVGQAAMAVRGWEENALFAPSRIGFAPAAGLTYDNREVHAALGTKLEILAKSGGKEPGTVEGQPAGAKLRDPTTSWVTGASFAYDFLDGKLTPGLRAWLAVFTQPLTIGTRDYSGPQLVVEPEVSSRIPITASIAVRAGAGFLIPLGGHLGGADDGSVNGVRLKAALLF
jgi:hypothetical protein